MATWIVHLRLADKLLDRIPGLAPVEFIMGNIAPDSGVPNEDGSAFIPSKNISHFKTDGINFDIAAFCAKYFTDEQRKQYGEKTYAFYLGYLVHLLSDTLWYRDIVIPSKAKFSAELMAGKQDFFRRLKEDWYDLDYKYLRDHPGFRAFRIYLGAVGFVNEYMEEFSRDAFDNRRQYITEFYLQGKDNLDRAYPYLTETEMEVFTDQAAAEIHDILHINYGLKL